MLLATSMLWTRTDAFSLPSSSQLQPPFQSPSSAEEAFQNQLFYYQTNDIQKAYECCSPGNQEATGSLDEFEQLHHVAPYDLILQHERADVLLEVTPDGGVLSNSFKTDDDEILDVTCILVCIRPNRKARRRYPVWFFWEMSLVQTSSSEDDPKWMVDCIMPDFEDLDFEAESLSIEAFGDEDGDDEDEVTIYWDFDA